MAVCGVRERGEGDWGGGGVRVRGGEEKEGERWGGGGEKPAWLPGEPPANRSVSKHTLNPKPFGCTSHVNSTNLQLVHMQMGLVRFLN